MEEKLYGCTIYDVMFLGKLAQQNEYIHLPL